MRPARARVPAARLVHERRAARAVGATRGHKVDGVLCAVDGYGGEADGAVVVADEAWLVAIELGSGVACARVRRGQRDSRRACVCVCAWYCVCLGLCVHSELAAFEWVQGWAARTRSVHWHM